MSNDRNRRHGGPARPSRPSQGGGRPPDHRGGSDRHRSPSGPPRGDRDRPRDDRGWNADPSRRNRPDRGAPRDPDRGDRGPAPHRSGPSGPGYGPPRRDDRRDPGRRDGGRPQGRDAYQRGGEGRRDVRHERGRRPDGPREGAPRPPSEPLRSRTGLDPFDLFCAYHLGIAADKSYRPANVNTVARRFGVSPAEIKQALQDFGMDAAVVMEKEFDMAMAQLDMELAPEGIDRVELARPIFEEFTSARRRKIDWRKIIEEDIRENAKVFGRKD